jgi:hypothetical protein
VLHVSYGKCGVLVSTKVSLIFFKSLYGHPDELYVELGTLIDLILGRSDQPTYVPFPRALA